MGWKGPLNANVANGSREPTVINFGAGLDAENAERSFRKCLNGQKELKYQNKLKLTTMFKNWDWSDTWMSLLYAICIFLLLSLGMCSFHKKETKGYSLGENENHLVIVREIEWWEDDPILLDRSVTYWEAIRMVDSLNKTLK